MSHRANGEGSVYRRKDGRWTGATYVLRPDGGRVRRTVYGRTREEVSRKVNALVLQAAAGIPAAGTSWTVDTYARHWLDHVAEPTLRPSTLAGYKTVLDLYVLPSLGTRRLASLTPTDVRRMLSSVRSKGLSARTAQLAHSVLRSVLGEAVRDQLLERNVATLVRPPRVVREEVKPWTPGDSARFLDSSRAHRLYALFAVGVALGLRRGELLGLRWEDVDLDRTIVHVRQTLQRIRGVGLVFGPPKSQRSRRSIPMPVISSDALQRHRAVQAEERLRSGATWTETGLVFTTTIGTPLEPRNLNRLFDELIAKADVRRIRFHDLRHTSASLMLAQGVPPRIVMEVLGHSQLSMTTDLYGHVMPTALLQASEAIDTAFNR